MKRISLTLVALSLFYAATAVAQDDKRIEGTPRNQVIKKVAGTYGFEIVFDTKEPTDKVYFDFQGMPGEAAFTKALGLGFEWYRAEDCVMHILNYEQWTTLRKKGLTSVEESHCDSSRKSSASTSTPSTTAVDSAVRPGQLYTMRTPDPTTTNRTPPVVTRPGVMVSPEPPIPPQLRQWQPNVRCGAYKGEQIGLAPGWYVRDEDDVYHPLPGGICPQDMYPNGRAEYGRIGYGGAGISARAGVSAGITTSYPVNYGGYGYGYYLNCATLPDDRNCTHGDLRIDGPKDRIETFLQGIDIYVDDDNVGPASKYNRWPNDGDPLEVGQHKKVQFVRVADDTVVYETQTNIRSRYVMKGQPNILRLDPERIKNAPFRKRIKHENPKPVPADQVLVQP
jgi:hypothetical protein